MNCGHKIKGEKAVCPSCGHKLQYQKTAKSNKVHYVQNIGEIRDTDQGWLDAILWVLFFPYCLIKLILSIGEESKVTKVLLIIGGAVLSIVYMAFYIALLFSSPGLIIIIMVIYALVYYVKAKKREEEVERFQKKRERALKEQMIQETLKAFFSTRELSGKLTEFVLKHTIKYDYGQINYDEYHEKVELFFIYLDKKYESQIIVNKDKYSEDLLKEWDNNNTLLIDEFVIEKYIKQEKMRIYSDNLKKKLNYREYNQKEELVNKYIDIFGDNALKELNVEILSVILKDDYYNILELVETEYKRVKDEYEMHKIEEQLFSSNLFHKEIEYIDSLKGLEFEDYLKELFINFGYTTEDLPYTNDYGADLIISKGLTSIVIQAKNYAGNVGNKAVQEVIAAKSHYKCDIGMVITNSYYTKNAIVTADASEIILIDRDELEKIIKEGDVYFSKLVS